MSGSQAIDGGGDVFGFSWLAAVCCIGLVAVDWFGGCSMKGYLVASIVCFVGRHIIYNYYCTNIQFTISVDNNTTFRLINRVPGTRIEGGKG